jgi:hypothetical protein
VAAGAGVFLTIVECKEQLKGNLARDVENSVKKTLETTYLLDYNEGCLVEKSKGDPWSYPITLTACALYVIRRILHAAKR